MLKIIYYKKSNEILKTELPSDLQVICPNPSEADAFREYTSSKFEVITIARWLGNLKLQAGLSRAGKADLLLKMASGWRNYFPNTHANIFFNAFELFTELRSFTLDLKTVTTLLENSDSDLKKSILIFWALMDAEKLVDEHLAYQLMQEVDESRPILFLGFKHLSSVQIETIKQISNERDVYFYLPEFVKKNAFATDWINWLDTISFKKIDENENRSSAKVLYFPSKKLNFYLKKYLNEKGGFDIAILGNEINIQNIQEVLINDILFKEAIDIFESAKISILKKFKNIKTLQKTEEIKVLIDLDYKNAIASQDFKMVKVCQIFLAALEVYGSYSIDMDDFGLAVIENVINLNTPRNYLIPLTEKSENRILTNSELKYLKSDKEIIIVIGKENSPFRSVGSKYIIDFEEKLKLIGPIRRSGLDILFLKSELMDLVSTKKITFFIEEGMPETDNGIRELLNLVEVEKVDLNISIENKTIRDYLNSNLEKVNLEKKTFSASKLQAYFDCPYKYYSSYVIKVDDLPKNKIGLKPDEIGNLEHLIIEEYITNNELLDIQKLKKKCSEKLNEHLVSNKIRIEFDEFNEALYELIEFTKNGIGFILDLKMQQPKVQIFFEYPLPENHLNLRGFIDCLVINESQAQIYDFKRSAFSIGSKKDLIAFKKLQLWVYANAIRKKYNVEKIGYINISEIESSVFLECGDLLNESEVKLSEIISKYRDDVQYKPMPRSREVCTFCAVEKICHKGILNDQNS